MKNSEWIKALMYFARDEMLSRAFLIEKGISDVVIDELLYAKLIKRAGETETNQAYKTPYDKYIVTKEGFAYAW